jgi:hypothetical protein
MMEVEVVKKPTRKRQRPLGRQATTGPGEQVVVRLHQPLLGILDDYCARQLLPTTRAEGIRQMMAQWHQDGRAKGK